MRARAGLIVAVVGVVLFCLLIFMFVIRPRQSELSDVRADVDAATTEQAQLQQQLEVLRDLQDRAPELQADLDQIRGFVPQEAEIPNFIFQVQQAANQSGVGLIQIQPELPKEPPEGAPLAEVRTIIRARGSYFAIQDFVRRLYDLDRALRIDTMALGEPGSGAEGTTTTTTTTGATSTAEEGDIEINMAARIFFELPGGAAGGAGTVPTTPATPAPSPTGTTPTEGTTPAEGTTPEAGTSPAPQTTP